MTVPPCAHLDQAPTQWLAHSRGNPELLNNQISVLFIALLALLRVFFISWINLSPNFLTQPLHLENSAYVSFTFNGAGISAGARGYSLACCQNSDVSNCEEHQSHLSPLSNPASSRQISEDRPVTGSDSYCLQRAEPLSQYAPPLPLPIGCRVTHPHPQRAAEQEHHSHGTARGNTHRRTHTPCGDGWLYLTCLHCWWGKCCLWSLLYCYSSKCLSEITLFYLSLSICLSSVCVAICLSIHLSIAIYFSPL